MLINLSTGTYCIKRTVTLSTDTRGIKRTTNTCTNIRGVIYYGYLHEVITIKSKVLLLQT